MRFPVKGAGREVFITVGDPKVQPLLFEGFYADDGDVDMEALPDTVRMFVNARLLHSAATTPWCAYSWTRAPT